MQRDKITVYCFKKALNEREEEGYKLSLDVMLGPKPAMLKQESIIVWKTRRVLLAENCCRLKKERGRSTLIEGRRVLSRVHLSI